MGFNFLNEMVLLFIKTALVCRTETKKIELFSMSPVWLKFDWLSGRREARKWIGKRNGDSFYPSLICQCEKSSFLFVSFQDGTVAGS